MVANWVLHCNRMYGWSNRASKMKIDMLLPCWMEKVYVNLYLSALYFTLSFRNSMQAVTKNGEAWNSKSLQTRYRCCKHCLQKLLSMCKAVDVMCRGVIWWDWNTGRDMAMIKVYFCSTCIHPYTYMYIYTLLNI